MNQLYSYITQSPMNPIRIDVRAYVGEQRGT